MLSGYWALLVLTNEIQDCTWACTRISCLHTLINKCLLNIYHQTCQEWVICICYKWIEWLFTLTSRYQGLKESNWQQVAYVCPTERKERGSWDIELLSCTADYIQYTTRYVFVTTSSMLTCTIPLQQYSLIHKIGTIGIPAQHCKPCPSEIFVRVLDSRIFNLYSP